MKAGEVAVAAVAGAWLLGWAMRKNITAEVKDVPSGAQSRIGSDHGIQSVFQERDSVTVRVPATSANLGPGFDCLGMALDIWTEVTIKRASSFSFDCEGEGANVLPRDETNLIYIGCKAAFEAANKPLPALAFYSINRIPFARGLGSSSAAIVAGLIAGLVLSGHELPVWGHEALLQLACEIEGHPDNAAPAIYGGVQLGVNVGRDEGSKRWMSCRIPCPQEMQCVLFVPDDIGETKAARAILPDKIDREDMVFNLGRLALLIEAFHTSNFTNLKFATQDKLHQPVRGAKQFPHLFPLIDAAIAAGAQGCYLSGAGPTVCAITSGRAGDVFTQKASERRDQQVADAMRTAADKCGTPGRIFITNPVGSGAFIASVDPPFSGGGVERWQGLQQV